MVPEISAIDSRETLEGDVIGELNIGESMSESCSIGMEDGRRSSVESIIEGVDKGEWQSREDVEGMVTGIEEMVGA